MSRKLHIYCSNEREVSTIDAPLSDVSWSLVVMMVDLFSYFDYCLEYISIAIKWMGFTKNNYLSSCIRYANALTAVIIFIVVILISAPFGIQLCAIFKLS